MGREDGDVDVRRKQWRAERTEPGAGHQTAKNRFRRARWSKLASRAGGGRGRMK